MLTATWLAHIHILLGIVVSLAGALLDAQVGRFDEGAAVRADNITVIVLYVCCTLLLPDASAVKVDHLQRLAVASTLPRAIHSDIAL